MSGRAEDTPSLELELVDAPMAAGLLRGAAVEEGDVVGEAGEDEEVRLMREAEAAEERRQEEDRLAFLAAKARKDQGVRLTGCTPTHAHGLVAQLCPAGCNQCGKQLLPKTSSQKHD